MGMDGPRLLAYTSSTAVGPPQVRCGLQCRNVDTHARTPFRAFPSTSLPSSTGTSGVEWMVRVRARRRRRMSVRATSRGGKRTSTSSRPRVLQA
ncbi:hypothetical protein EON67_11515, partial [archaeon]